jgi:uncharacterized protein (DUF952 family)
MAIWESTQGNLYRAASLESEGFIHCSHENQVERIANQFYAQEKDLQVLVIDAGKLTSPLRDEDPGSGERFPHVYGPITQDAVIEVRKMTRSATGKFVL